jgi:hypothetical protein
MTLQNQMQAKLAQVGIPYRTINVYGSQIVITTTSRNTAAKWHAVLARFAKVRGTIKDIDYATVNRGTVLNRSTVQVFRTYATI